MKVGSALTVSGWSIADSDFFAVDVDCAGTRRRVLVGGSRGCLASTVLGHVADVLRGLAEVNDRLTVNEAVFARVRDRTDVAADVLFAGAGIVPARRPLHDAAAEPG